MRRIGQAADYREILWLVKNGVPWDVAACMEPIQRQATAVIFSEMEGHTFDWYAMRFEKADS